MDIKQLEQYLMQSDLGIDAKQLERFLSECDLDDKGFPPRSLSATSAARSTISSG